MSTPQFTPGPWRAVLRGQLSYVAGPDGFIAQMLGTEGQRGDARAEANASLTAAGPEMFGALHSALTWMQTYKRHCGIPDGGPLSEDIAKAVVALAKASPTP